MQRIVRHMTTKTNEPLIMYLILNKSLADRPNWTTGSIIAQAAHAATKCLWQFKDDPCVIDYMLHPNSMHKVILQLKNESQLRTLKSRLLFDCVEWIEQPENLLCCIALKPIRKSEIGDALKKCSLYK